jgi:hypothetical protein
MFQSLRSKFKLGRNQVIIAVVVLFVAVMAGVAYRERHERHERQRPGGASVSPTSATTNPGKLGMFVSSDGTGNPGTWVALQGVGTTYTGTVQPAGMMVSTDGTGNPGSWVAATSTTFQPPITALQPPQISTHNTSLGATTLYVNYSGTEQFVEAIVSVRVTTPGSGGTINSRCGTSDNAAVSTGTAQNPANANAGNTSTAICYILLPPGGGAASIMYYFVDFNTVTTAPTYELYVVTYKLA